MLIYAALGGAGLLLLFVMLAASSFGDHDVPIHEGGLDHGDLDAHGGPSPLGTRVIAAFLTFFGVGGILGQHLELGHPASSAIGIGLGLAAATVVHRFATLLHSQQASVTLSMRSLVAKPASVTVAIPENGVGAVALTVGLEETVQLARSADGRPIELGGEVIIKAVRGSQVIVEQASSRSSSSSPQGATS